jgi:redox-sensing transcriptional repressor
MDHLVVDAMPRTTVARLPVYLRALLDEAIAGVTLLSSERLAALTGVGAATVRKDLASLGSTGIRGVGYDVRALVDQIAGSLGLHQPASMVIVGVGNIGRALAQYGGFGERGFRLVALFDVDPAKVGSDIAGLTVEPIDALARVIAESRPTIAIVAVPPDDAQEVVDRVVASGVTSILSFHPAKLTVPSHVVLRNLDLAVELEILAYMHSQPAQG